MVESTMKQDFVFSLLSWVGKLGFLHQSHIERVLFLAMIQPTFIDQLLNKYKFAQDHWVWAKFFFTLCGSIKAQIKLKAWSKTCHARILSSPMINSLCISVNLIALFLDGSLYPGLIIKHVNFCHHCSQHLSVKDWHQNFYESNLKTPQELI